jgi:hypothetical protein
MMTPVLEHAAAPGWVRSRVVAVARPGGRRATGGPGRLRRVLTRAQQFAGVQAAIRHGDQDHDGVARHRRPVRDADREVGPRGPGEDDLDVDGPVRDLFVRADRDDRADNDRL